MAEELHVEAIGKTVGGIQARVYDFQIVDLVRNEVAKILVVCLAGELEGAPHGTEGIVGP